MCGTTWLLLSNTAVQNPAGVFTLFISFGFKTAATTLYQHLFLHIGRELRTHLCFFFFLSFHSLFISSICNLKLEKLICNLITLFLKNY